MPSTDVFGAHYVLRQTNPGRTHRLDEVIDEAYADELSVRREVDKLALAGRIERLYVGQHVMLKKTDKFDPENAPDVTAAKAREESGRILSPSEYERPSGTVIDPTEEYEAPSGEGPEALGESEVGDADD
jgi:hypothetical protein